MHAADPDLDLALAIVLVDVGEIDGVGAARSPEGEAGRALAALQADDLAARRVPHRFVGEAAELELLCLDGELRASIEGPVDPAREIAIVDPGAADIGALDDRQLAAGRRNVARECVVVRPVVAMVARQLDFDELVRLAALIADDIIFLGVDLGALLYQLAVDDDVGQLIAAIVAALVSVRIAGKAGVVIGDDEERGRARRHGEVVAFAQLAVVGGQDVGADQGGELELLK